MLQKDFNITENIKIIEGLKYQLLENVSVIFKGFLSENLSSDMLVESIADNILLSYLLAGRIGLDYSLIDKSIKEKIKLGILDNKYDDFLQLSKHLNGE